MTERVRALLYVVMEGDDGTSVVEEGKFEGGAVECAQQLIDWLQVQVDELKRGMADDD